MSPKAKKEFDFNNASQSEMENLLAENGLASLIHLADYYQTDLVVYSTGFPGVDQTLQSDTPGLAIGIDVEIYSDKGSAGKTTLALQILKAWQDQGLKTLFIDVETAPGLEKYMNYLGILTKPDLTRPGIHPVYILRGEKDSVTRKVKPLTLEDILDTLEKSAKHVFDLCIVDSVDSMQQKAEQEKGASDNAQWGGISRKMSEFMRKMTVKNGTVIWLNQTRASNGYSPTGTPPKVTSGGNAINFYGDIRIKIDYVGKLELPDGTEYGFKSKMTVIKNKTDSRGRGRTYELKYINGEGFSVKYDYFEAAIKEKVIIKGGAGWYTFPDVDLKVQGEYNMYKAIAANEKGSFDKLVSLFDGEDVAEIDQIKVTDDVEFGEGNNILSRRSELP